jgi:nitrogen regulatory protein P-II 1
MRNIKALFVVVNAGFAEKVIEIARAEGAGGATIINARGEGSNIKKIMGITVDSEKEIILSLVDGDTASRIMSVVKDAAGICSPAHGVCFTLPVDQTTGLSQLCEQ